MSAFVMEISSLSSVAECLEIIIFSDYCNTAELKQAFGEKANYTSIFRELYRINELSVNARYREDNEQYADIAPSKHPIIINRAQLIKSLQCWLYQSCEFEGYKDNPVYNAIDNLTYRWLMPKELKDNDPYYRDAEWK